MAIARPVILALCVVAVTAFSGAASAAKVTDPRKCSTNLYGDRDAHCAESAATIAFRRHMARTMGIETIWTNQLRCVQGRTVLVWRCAFGPRYESGAGTVTYRALPSGWYVRVSVSCRDPATTPRGGCNR